MFTVRVHGHTGQAVLSAAEILAIDGVDGALVGGASLDVRAFFDIITKSRPATV